MILYKNIAYVLTTPNITLDGKTYTAHSNIILFTPSETKNYIINCPIRCYNGINIKGYYVEIVPTNTKLRVNNEYISCENILAIIVPHVDVYIEGGKVIRKEPYREEFSGMIEKSPSICIGNIFDIHAEGKVDIWLNNQIYRCYGRTKIYSKQKDVVIHGNECKCNITTVPSREFSEIQISKNHEIYFFEKHTIDHYKKIPLSMTWGGIRKLYIFLTFEVDIASELYIECCYRRSQKRHLPIGQHTTVSFEIYPTVNILSSLLCVCDNSVYLREGYILSTELCMEYPAYGYITDKTYATNMYVADGKYCISNGYVRITLEWNSEDMREIEINDGKYTDCYTTCGTQKLVIFYCANDSHLQISGANTISIHNIPTIYPCEEGIYNVYSLYSISNNEIKRVSGNLTEYTFGMYLHVQICIRGEGQGNVEFLGQNIQSVHHKHQKGLMTRNYDEKILYVDGEDMIKTSINMIDGYILVYQIFDLM